MRWDEQRAAAAEIPCSEPGCHAPAGEPCRNVVTGAELVNRPAHERRLWESGAADGPPPRQPALTAGEDTSR